MHEKEIRHNQNLYREVGENLEYDRWFDMPVRTCEGWQPVRELIQRILTSNDVEYMHGQELRFWHAFAYDRETMIEQLGDDAKPVEHMYQTAVFAAKILEAQIQAGEVIDIVPQHVGLTLLAIATHDIGESMHPDIKDKLGFVVGDIQRGRKTDLDRQKETAIRRYVWRETLSELNDEDLDFMEMVVAHKHEDYDDPSVRLGEAAHSVQSLDTAMRARQSFYDQWNKYVAGNDISDRAVAMYRAPAALYAEVCTAVIPEIETWAQEFMFINDFRREYLPEIMMFNAGHRLLQPEQPLRDNDGNVIVRQTPRVGRVFDAIRDRMPALLDRVVTRGVNATGRRVFGADLGYVARVDQNDPKIYPLS